MKKQIKITALGILFILQFMSCEKENTTSNSGSTKKQSTLTELFKNIAPTRQNFSVTAGQTQTITGEKGTKITFYANSFKKKDGTILTSGSVNILLQEMLTGSEMILANKTTTSDGKLLESGGQIYIRAFSQGEELSINSNAKPTTDIPTNASSSIGIYKGSVKENDSVKGDSVINWEDTKDTAQVRQDTFGRSFHFQFGDFGYWNCDQLYNDPRPKTELHIKTPSGFVDSNTAIFIYFTSINSVAKCEGFLKATNEFILNHALAPVGMNIKIVLVTKKDNKFYYDMKSATITDGYSTTMNPTEMTEAAIKLAIKNL